MGVTNMRRLRFKLACLIYGSLLTACGGSEEPHYEVIAREVFHPSCQPATVTIQQVREAVSNARLTPRSESCAVDGLLRPSICGIPTGYLHLIDVPVNQVHSAKTLGYVSVSSYPQMSRIDCPL